MLSSSGELRYSCSVDAKPGEETSVLATCFSRPTLRPWDPMGASETAYPITTYQPTYFVAQRLAHCWLYSQSFLDLARFVCVFSGHCQPLQPVRRIVQDEITLRRIAQAFPCEVLSLYNALTKLALLPMMLQMLSHYSRLRSFGTPSLCCPALLGYL